ncbi:hypothetical protein [Armatimonas sp.]|uniref:hypothetical protein n=1 Tax=Armatimonas sp. TaxID=1872638 RepID=UPI00286B8FE7|nr:hypothetical protein [Armatimonas sp.]
MRLTDGTLRLVRRRWLRQEVLIRENYVEHRVIFRGWRRVIRITDGWVYIERVETKGNWQRYRVRVRGTGGELVLTDRQWLGWEENAVPEALARQAELVAQETGWRLDVPYLLRRGSHIRTV